VQKLLIFQSLWGMERLRSETAELALEEKIARIAHAGFDGVTDHFYDRDLTDRWADALRLRDMVQDRWRRA